MVFNSLTFFQFAFVFFGLWPFIRKTKVRYVFLIGASCLFYGYAGWWFVPLLIATATIDFYVAQAIYDADEHKKKHLLVYSLLGNLGVLGFFKYSGFLATNVNVLAKAIGVPSALPVLSFILPVGISFYTFQSLAYVFDVYAGRLVPTRKPLHFLSIVTLFPHLVAGPIVRIRHILPQIEELKPATAKDAWDGLNLITYGLFKKVVLADNLAPYVDSVYSGNHGNAGSHYVLATICFAFQIFYDFSGYTDIARGLARWIGIEFELNFNNPYCAIGFSDFWSRWHISLSRWIRDYIYIPLGGSRVSEPKVHRNIWYAMLLSGLWHGANFTYIIWGGLHALYQSVERITGWPDWCRKSHFGRLLGVGLTFTLVCIAWVLFRADNLSHAAHIFSMMAKPTAGLKSLVSTMTGANFKLALVTAVLLEGWHVFLVVMKLPPDQRMSNALMVLRNVAFIMASILFTGPGKAFIYFQF